jgi:tetratricopeptide (TPR) repeat protein
MTTLTFTTNNFDTQFNFEATRQGSAWRLRSVTFDSALGVPEPGTLALMGAGLIGLALWRRRRHAPSHGPANNRLGEIVLLNGDSESARKYFSKAMEAQPPVPFAFFHAGSLLAQEGKLEEAAPYFERCVELAPDTDAALNNLAYVLAETGTDLDQALTYAQRAMARNPESADYADTLGYVYVKRNLNDNAIEVLRGIVDKHPARADFRYHLGMALYQNGDEEQARTELEG